MKQDRKLLGSKKCHISLKSFCNLAFWESGPCSRNKVYFAPCWSQSIVSWVVISPREFCTHQNSHLSFVQSTHLLYTFPSFHSAGTPSDKPQHTSFKLGRTAARRRKRTRFAHPILLPGSASAPCTAEQWMSQSCLKVCCGSQEINGTSWHWASILAGWPVGAWDSKLPSSKV